MCVVWYVCQVRKAFVCLFIVVVHRIDGIAEFSARVLVDAYRVNPDVAFAGGIRVEQTRSLGVSDVSCDYAVDDTRIGNRATLLYFCSCAISEAQVAFRGEEAVEVNSLWYL